MVSSFSDLSADSPVEFCIIKDLRDTSSVHLKRATFRAFLSKVDVPRGASVVALLFSEISHISNSS